MTALQSPPDAPIGAPTRTAALILSPFTPDRDVGDRCNYCGSEPSNSDGYYSTQRGFLCSSCVETLHMRPCSFCGMKFPLMEMKELEGDLYCGDDYSREKSIIDAEKEKDRIRHPDHVQTTVISLNVEDSSIYDKPLSERIAEERKAMYERSESRQNGASDVDKMVYEAFIKKMKSLGNQAPKPSHF